MDPWQKNIIFSISTVLLSGVETASVTQKKSFGGLAWQLPPAVYGVTSSLGQEEIGMRAAMVAVNRKDRRRILDIPFSMQFG